MLLCASMPTCAAVAGKALCEIVAKRPAGAGTDAEREPVRHRSAAVVDGFIGEGEAPWRANRVSQNHKNTPRLTGATAVAT